MSADTIERNALEKALARLERKAARLSAVDTLFKQLKENEVLKFWPIGNAYTEKHYTFIKNGLLWTRTGRNDEIVINPTKRIVMTKFVFEDGRTIERIKSAIDTLIAFNSEFKSAVRLNKIQTKAETEKEKKRDTGSLRRFFTDENVDNMTLIEDTENPCHWAWGAVYRIFVYKGRLYRFEVYNDSANGLREDGTIGRCTYLCEVKNTGEGDVTELPVVRDYLRTAYPDGYVRGRIDLEELLQEPCQAA